MAAVDNYLNFQYYVGVKNLYIFGAGEFASIAHKYFSAEGKYVFRGFVVDDLFFDKEHSIDKEEKLPLFKFSEISESLTENDTDVFVAISASKMNTLREVVFKRLEALGCKFATYVSPYAFVSDDANLGPNVFVFENNVIQNGVKVGANSILWSGNHVGHHAKIGQNSFVSSHVVISGYCEIGRNSYLGVNSTIVDHIEIGEMTLVGAGAVVTRSTEPSSVYVGSPAKKIDGKNPLEVDFR